MARIRIKLCGTTNSNDAFAAIDAGVDGLGFIFVAMSPRNVHPDAVRAITGSLPPFISRVGVFVDQPIDQVVHLAQFCRLTHIQLHGKERPEYCRVLADLCGCSLIKAFRVSQDSVADDFSIYDNVVNGFLLDTYKKGIPGGTGEAFDWRIVERLSLRRPVILAGGLGLDNIDQAVKTVKPFGIDINSGVEKRPGVKDHQKLRDLITKVRLVESEIT